MNECTVCFGEQWLTFTKCNHQICIECLFQLKKDECPICRREIVKTLPTYLQQYMTCTRKKEHLDVSNLEQFPRLS